MTEENLPELLESAEEQVAVVEARVAELAAEWGVEEGAAVERFLLDEGRHTVVKQSDVTEKVRDQIPAVRAKVERIAAVARSAVEVWAKELTPETLSSRPRLKESFDAVVAPSSKEFGKVFTALGYQAGHGRWDDEWQFYYPQTGTARSASVPLSHSSEITEQLSILAELRRRAEQIRRQIREQDARDLWG